MLQLLDGKYDGKLRMNNTHFVSLKKYFPRIFEEVLCKLSSFLVQSNGDDNKHLILCSHIILEI